MASTTPKLTVYRGADTPTQHVWSPFVTKLEARLRFAGVPYTPAAGSPNSAPKGKIPYVDVAAPGSGSSSSTTQLSDSTLIINALTAQDVLPDLNAKLSPAARTQDLALRALLEEKLYFYSGRERWQDNYPTMRDHTLSAIPYPLRLLIGLLISRTMTATLHGQGTGRFSDAEVRVLRDEVYAGLNDLLLTSRTHAKGGSSSTEAPFWALGGAEPTEADATLYGFIVSALICTAGPESQKIVRTHPAILDYADRIHKTYFSDYEKWEI
ncbi:hypothetical protein F5Y15DRAFT_371516 [Xylariaceae sp. FL0016]|nr:hypothetical protein F5Y15DRAFT_371516 [Xylariaceae sp. FL0016]